MEEVERLIEKLKKYRERIERPLTKKKVKLKERYTITGDIISYKICPRQYGLYKFYGFSPSNPTQEWYGSIIHRLLKRLHTTYRIEKRIVKDEREIEKLFNLIEISMESEGRRASSPKAREKALQVIITFCKKYGEELIPKIKEAELRLLKEMDNYILYGIVDAVLNNEEYEIWDYKGMERPDPKKPSGKKKIELYKKQLFVYGYLFKERNGNYPKKGVLMFLNELLKEKGEPFLEIEFDRKETIREVEDFIREFSEIVKEIEKSKEENRWELPKEIDEKVCKQCDFKFDCERFRNSL